MSASAPAPVAAPSTPPRRPDSTPPMPQYNDDQVVAAVDLHAAIETLRTTFLAAHDDRAVPVAKTMAEWQDGDAVSSAHALGAIDLAAQRLAFKYWVNTPRGAQALLTLFDLDRGCALASMEAGALGMLRTSGTVALATDALADPDADRLAVLGTGRQALHQVRAVAQVRVLREINVWSRNAAHAQTFAELLASDLGLTTRVHTSVADAVRDMPIVTTVTRAREPFLALDVLAGGVHLNAVGAILPTHRELSPGVAEAADLVVVDDRENCRRAAAELGDLDVARLPTLGAVLAGDVVRPAAPRLTVFKTVGTGLGDLAVAIAAYTRLLEG